MYLLVMNKWFNCNLKQYNPNLLKLYIKKKIKTVIQQTTVKLQQ